MRPIPKALLIHTVTLAKTVPEDRWGTKSLTGQKDLKRVKVEPSSKIVRNKNGAEIQLVATLLYDCKNSLPRGVQFAVDDIIIFNGQKHSIQLAEPLYDGKKLHHYEVGLIAHA